MGHKTYWSCSVGMVKNVTKAASGQKIKAYGGVLSGSGKNVCASQSQY